MSKKAIKVISIITIILCAVMVATTCFAVTTNDIKGDANISTEQIGKAGNQLATIIRAVGIVAAVLILMILGIKYMLGSAEEKAEYKKTMIPYIVGAVVLFGASALAGSIVQMAQGITG